jgi:hypothetical protein
MVSITRRIHVNTDDEQMDRYSASFKITANCPNYIGAVDDKHTRIIKPEVSG